MPRRANAFASFLKRAPDKRALTATFCYRFNGIIEQICPKSLANQHTIFFFQKKKQKALVRRCRKFFGVDDPGD
jgi:hypothetical protein